MKNSVVRMLLTCPIRHLYNISLLPSAAVKIDTVNKQPPVTSTPQGVYPITEVEEEMEAPTGVYVYALLQSPSYTLFFPQNSQLNGYCYNGLSAQHVLCEALTGRFRF